MKVEQIIKTFCKKGINGSGSCIYSYSKNIESLFNINILESEQLLNEYDLPFYIEDIFRPIFINNNQNEINEIIEKNKSKLPIRIRSKYDSNNIYIMSQCIYLGAIPFESRYSNYISHGIVLNKENYLINPGFLMLNNVFLNSIDEKSVCSPNKPEYLDQLFMEQEKISIASKNKTFMADRITYGTYKKLLYCLIKNLENKRKIFIYDHHENLPLWISSLLLAFPIKIALSISFSTYEKNPFTSPYTIIGVVERKKYKKENYASNDYHFDVFDNDINDFDISEMNEFCEFVGDSIINSYNKLQDFHTYLINFPEYNIDTRINQPYRIYTLSEGTKKLNDLTYDDLKNILDFATQYGNENIIKELTISILKYIPFQTDGLSSNSAILKEFLINSNANISDIITEYCVEVFLTEEKDHFYQVFEYFDKKTDLVQNLKYDFIKKYIDHPKKSSISEIWWKVLFIIKPITVDKDYLEYLFANFDAIFIMFSGIIEKSYSIIESSVQDIFLKYYEVNLDFVNLLYSKIRSKLSTIGNWREKYRSFMALQQADTILSSLNYLLLNNLIVDAEHIAKLLFIDDILKSRFESEVLQYDSKNIQTSCITLIKCKRKDIVDNILDSLTLADRLIIYKLVNENQNIVAIDYFSEYISNKEFVDNFYNENLTDLLIESNYNIKGKLKERIVELFCSESDLETQYRNIFQKYDTKKYDLKNVILDSDEVVTALKNERCKAEFILKIPNFNNDFLRKFLDKNSFANIVVDRYLENVSDSSLIHVLINTYKKNNVKNENLIEFYLLIKNILNKNEQINVFDELRALFFSPNDIIYIEILYNKNEIDDVEFFINYLRQNCFNFFEIVKQINKLCPNYFKDCGADLLFDCIECNIKPYSSTEQSYDIFEYVYNNGVELSKISSKIFNQFIITNITNQNTISTIKKFDSLINKINNERKQKIEYPPRLALAVLNINLTEAKLEIESNPKIKDIQLEHLINHLISKPKINTKDIESKEDFFKEIACNLTFIIYYSKYWDLQDKLFSEKELFLAKEIFKKMCHLSKKDNNYTPLLLLIDRYCSHFKDIIYLQEEQNKVIRDEIKSIIVEQNMIKPKELFKCLEKNQSNLDYSTITNFIAQLTCPAEDKIITIPLENKEIARDNIKNDFKIPFRSIYDYLLTLYNSIDKNVKILCLSVIIILPCILFIAKMHYMKNPNDQTRSDDNNFTTAGSLSTSDQNEKISFVDSIQMWLSTKSERIISKFRTSSESSTMYQIGDISPIGGTIFYIEKDDTYGWHYLEFNLNDLDKGYIPNWSDDRFVEIYELEKSLYETHKIGSGLLQNKRLHDLMSELGQPNTTIWGCNKINNFYQPRIFELELLYQNIYLKEKGNFINNRYLSSSYDKAGNVLIFNFDTGETEMISNEDLDKIKVRPVRYFYRPSDWGKR